MHLFKLTNTFYYLLLSSNLVLHTVLGIDPINVVCSGATFSPRDGFESNLNSLIIWLSSSAPRTGFAKNSMGQKSSDQVQGLALCTGDIRNQSCQTCLETASSEIRSRCPSDKTASIWYDNCMLKYSNVKFLGRIDRRYFFSQCNPEKVTNHATNFRRKRARLLRLMTSQAFFHTTLYGVGGISLEKSSIKIYALAQCTRDISGYRCKKCLRHLTRYIIRTCWRNIGGKVYNGSCSVRFEKYSFASIGK
ncbi:hypothetical protein K2173_009337 [Erythroxylum novogranatense]|uniref:Gnk2-homologous domain-containing protein n=1 Tax=Erythroxylum novogranatense TaxID=1862640 RepID=A0AAV8U3P2_9ROSI|nr:hypothetical protein K2173_009337 [Erythroxylum novogranatense]